MDQAVELRPALRAAVLAILRTVWDRIRIADLPQPFKRNADYEHEAYGDPVLALLADRGEFPTIERYLHTVESERMGLGPDTGRAGRAAGSLFNLPDMVSALRA